jgi:hypothetical protein
MKQEYDLFERNEDGSVKRGDDGKRVLRSDWKKRLFKIDWLVILFVAFVIFTYFMFNASVSEYKAVYNDPCGYCATAPTWMHGYAINYTTGFSNDTTGNVTIDVIN